MKHLLPALLLAVISSFNVELTFAEGMVLNANTASTVELASIPNLDEDLVGAIVKNRPFATIKELDELLGADLDNDELQSLYAHLFVPINLNTADKSDILLIPGVAEKMAHEFEEYRPYSNIEQFRREMAKYVDKAEVARLEQYVTLD